MLRSFRAPAGVMFGRGAETTHDSAILTPRERERGEFLDRERREAHPDDRVVGAACLGGLRWCLTQSLFSLDDACAEDPVVVVYHVSPAGVATLVPIALALEARKLAYWAGLVEPRGLAEAAAVSCCGGCIAYFMLLAEIQLLRSTSSLSLSVVGALKDVSQIALAAATFGDTLSPQSLSGLGVVVSASLAFAKYRERGTGDYRRQQARYRPVRLPTADLDGDGFDDCDLADDDLSDNTLELAEF